MKEDLATEKGYRVIRIRQTDVFNDVIDWKKDLMDAVNYVADKEPCVKVLYNL